MAALLALLMLLSMAAMTIQLLSMNAYASDITPYYTEDEKEILIAVGLMYADGVTVGFETRAANGFTAGALNADRHFTPLYTIDNDCVSVTCDSNLAKTGMTYTISSQTSLAAGGWHLETMADADAFALFALCENIAAPYNYNVFQAAINGQTKIRIGQFGSQAEAESAMSAFAAEGIEVTIAAPSVTAVSVIDPYTDRILFEFDGGTETSLGLKPVQTGAEPVYLITPAKNTYGGIFKYSRWRTGSIDGIAVTNILPLEEYVEGVLPWEVGNGWAQEVLRTFAIAARSYALSSRKHDTFDLCNSTCCQAYRGRNRTNAAITEAVSNTSDIVLTYNNKIVCTYYSSSTGGTTVSASDAWGYTEKYPYLRAVVTPWELYNTYPNASWKTEFNSAQLLAKLNAAGYNTLSGGIKSVEIVSYAENSSYVKSLKITDIKNVSVTINRSDSIRSGLGLNSANFVVAKTGESVVITDYSLEGDGIATLFETQPADETPENTSTVKGGVYVLSDKNATATVIPAGESIVLTAELGMDTNFKLNDLSVITESGIQTFNMTETDNLIYSGEKITPPSVNLPDLAAVNVITTQRTVTADGNAGSFVFIGRGWGHGVGMSQYGAKALADLGYDHETILKTYFPGTVASDYKTIIMKQTNPVS